VPVVKHHRHTSSTSRLQISCCTPFIQVVYHPLFDLTYTLDPVFNSLASVVVHSLWVSNAIISSWGIIRTVVRHDNQSHALMDIVQASHNSPTSLRAVSTMLIQAELGTSRMLQRPSIAPSSYPTPNQQQKVQSLRSSISSLSPHRLPTMGRSKMTTNQASTVTNRTESSWST
jgi:hypothetical protein